MFRSSHDSIIKENINKIMQITAFKAILARRTKSWKIEQELHVEETKPPIVNQQCVV